MQENARDDKSRLVINKIHVSARVCLLESTGVSWSQRGGISLRKQALEFGLFLRTQGAVYKTKILLL